MVKTCFGLDYRLDVSIQLLNQDCQKYPKKIREIICKKELQKSHLESGLQQFTTPGEAIQLSLNIQLPQLDNSLHNLAWDFTKILLIILKLH